MDKLHPGVLFHQCRRSFNGVYTRRLYVPLLLIISILLFWWLSHGDYTTTEVVLTRQQLVHDNSLTFYEKMKALDDAKDSIDLHGNSENIIDNDNINQATTNKLLKTSNHLNDNPQVDSNHPIRLLFEKLFRIVDSVEPAIGYMSRNEMELTIKPKRNKSLKNLIPRIMGKNIARDIASHESADNDKYLSKSYLESCLQVPDKLFKSLKASHEKFVESIPNSYLKGTYEGNGIVIIAGDKFSWLSLLSVENLRATGSKLPVEVMIPQLEEYEPQLCEIILPKLNARCVKLYEFLPKFSQKNNSEFKRLSGYQYKSLSLLASRFENVLFLDSDNIPIKNPDMLFYSEPFKSEGMILWPDFWRRVTHPKYYDITGKQIGNTRIRYWSDTITPPELYNKVENNDIALHDLQGTIPDLSSESGQLLVNKHTHFSALLLSFYYNVYGPRHYYPLFSQGGSGEGDKETFIAAANFYNLPYYQVKKSVGVVGHWDGEIYHGVGMIQYDPIIDMKNGIRYKEDLDRLIKEHEEHGDIFQYKFTDFLHYFDENAEPIFFHCNFPKIDPIGLITDGKLINQNDGKQWRLYADQPDLGFDFELRQWQLIHHYFCSTDFKLNLLYLRDVKLPHNEICSAIEARVAFLQSNPL